MQIQTAVSADIPQLCLLLDSLFSQEAEFKPDIELQALGLGAIIEGDGIGDILVVKDGGQIIGMVNLLYTISTALGSRVAILEDMVVAPQSRGLGVGSALLKHAIDFAKQKDCKRITLLTDNDNVAAHGFYQQHGFTESSMLAFRLFLDV
ncbi:MAG: GNAT family N-acetyltransferase [Methylophaga sp.]|uniref:GNAT family N-acetyltransferase n=1 Tax=Methylophaga sp. TaxID=2024840 RepID=UPI00299DB779|nr:GNAT family N-acetyltransferase [Methylophaga sp.]MDX1750009.1 GNAT family N-acetyltransferase [Methylophaga sp.]